jgi:hypothetical protein
MSPQQFLNKYAGQSLLWAPSPAREYLRGQCVQSVCFYVVANNKPVLWMDASEWWYSGALPEHYERIANTTSAVPQTGDIIVWDRNLPNSGGAGHIAVCLYPLPGTGTFVSVDQNWGGKTVHAVTHNYNYVVGWLRIKGLAQPAPTPITTQGANDMITRTGLDFVFNQLLGRAPEASAYEHYVGKYSTDFVIADVAGSAEHKAHQSALDQNIGGLQNKLNGLSNTINEQNAAIAQLHLQINDLTMSNQDKQKALDEALGKIANANANLATVHDQIVDAQKPTEQPKEAPKKRSLFTRLILLGLLFNKKKDK